MPAKPNSQWQSRFESNRRPPLTLGTENPSLSAVDSGLPAITPVLGKRDDFLMTKYWEEPTVRYRRGPTSATAQTAQTAQTARMQLPRTSRTASIPAPAHHRVHRHPATAVVPTQPSTAKAKAEP